jgi:hypothetical protein
MSVYTTIAGRIRYRDEFALRAAYSLLETGGWLRDGHLLNESGRPITSVPNVDQEALTLDIPLSLYRGMARFLDADKLFVGGKGKVVWSSTDGVFAAGVIVNGVETGYDLKKWAKEQGYTEDDLPAVDDPEEVASWQNEVERDFFEVMMYSA